MNAPLLILLETAVHGRGRRRQNEFPKISRNSLFKRLNLLVFDGFEGKSVLNHRFRAQILYASDTLSEQIMTSVFRTIDPQQQSPKNRSTLAQGSDPLQNEVGFPANPGIPSQLLLGMLCKLTNIGSRPIRRYPECLSSRL